MSHITSSNIFQNSRIYRRITTAETWSILYMSMDPLIQKYTCILYTNAPRLYTAMSAIGQPSSLCAQYSSLCRTSLVQPHIVRDNLVKNLRAVACSTMQYPACSTMQDPACLSLITSLSPCGHEGT